MEGDDMEEDQDEEEEIEDCMAGFYVVESGNGVYRCEQCPENSWSEEGSSSCNECPEGHMSEAGSSSQDDCHSGN